MATLLLAARKIQPDVIVIDEPELGLHPLAIRILTNMLKQAAENVQILVATQSPLFLDFFEGYYEVFSKGKRWDETEKLKQYTGIDLSVKKDWIDRVKEQILQALRECGA